MTRRYTGAEARVLLEAARVQYIEPGRTVILPGTNAANARLLLAAPDLAESVSAVEAERDALRVERDAYREYYRARQALITADDADSTSVLFAAEDRVSAARERIAALREAAK